MTQKAFVVFVYLIVYKSLLPYQCAADVFLKPLHYFLQYRLVENHSLSGHYAGNILTCEHLPAFQDDAVATGIEHIHPQFLVKYHRRPICLLAVGSCNNLRLGYVVAQNALRAFKLEGYVFYYYHLKCFHCLSVFI